MMECNLSVEGLPDIRLAVWEGDCEWKWVMILKDSDVILAEGAGKSKLAAQIACQLAYEAWLRQKERRFGVEYSVKWNGQYQWRPKAKDRP